MDKEIPISASQTFNCKNVLSKPQDFKIFGDLSGRLSTWELNKSQSAADLTNLTTGEGSAGHSGLLVTVRRLYPGNCWEERKISIVGQTLS